MASPIAEDGTPEPQVVFRANKKRKAYRQRAEASGDAEDVVGAAPTAADKDEAANGQTQSEDVTETAVAEALRLRNARKSRLKGVGFTVESAARDGHADDDANDERSLVVRGQEEPAPVGGIPVRFAPQTGLTGELVNKHM